MIERAPSLGWRLHTSGRRDLSYQRPVVMGFRRVANPRCNVDPETLVTVYGHGLVAGLDPPGDAFGRVPIRHEL